MGRSWMLVLRSPILARAAAVVALCGLTALLQFSDLRYETARSALVPGMFAPNWGVSQRGVAVFRDDPSIAVLTRSPGQPLPFLLREVPNFRGAEAVRIRIEARAQDVVPGRFAWQAGRVMLWSYDRSGRRLRYLPYEVARVDGSGDWTRASLVVPVIPAIAGIRVVIVQAGLAGAMAVRSISVDAVKESNAYLAARGVLIALWIAAAAWVVVPMFRRLTPLRGVAAVLLVLTLAGAFTPQPYLSDTIDEAAAEARDAVAPVRVALTRWLAPAATETAGESQAVAVVTVDTETAPPAAQAPAPAQAAPAVPAAPAAPSTITLLLTDFSPRLSVKWGHFLAFAALAAVLPFAFPAARRRQIFGGLLLLGISIEMVQSFSITRSPEFSDFLRDTAGAAVGLAFALAWQFRRYLRKRAA
jgi:hypothetical protein